MQLRVADSLHDPRDCARLCLALPPLGLLAKQSLARYQQFVMKVGMELVVRGAAIDDAFFRRYARDRRANYDGILWLNTAAAAEGSAWSVLVSPQSVNMMRWLLRDSSGMGTWLRLAFVKGAILHFEGARGDERQVRLVHANGCITHFEGPKDAERQVRTGFADGSVIHFEGARDFERKLLLVHANGMMIMHFEGEAGAERQVRMELADGTVVHFEGEAGAERQVPAP